MMSILRPKRCSPLIMDTFYLDVSAANKILGIKTPTPNFAVNAYFGVVLVSETESDFSSEEENESLKERIPFPSSPMVLAKRPGPNTKITMISTMISSVGPISNIFYFLSRQVYLHLVKIGLIVKQFVSTLAQSAKVETK